MKQWLRNRLNKKILIELHRRDTELAAVLIDSAWDPKYPNGHPHTLGTRDGILHAIRLLEGRD